MRIGSMAAILGILLAASASRAEPPAAGTLEDRGLFPLMKFLGDFSRPAAEERDPFEERIETDRHDFTQSTRTVGRGVTQLESGYSYFYRDREEVIEHSHTLPEMMLRRGLSENIELRLRWNHAWRFSDTEENRSGWEDLRWAFKLGMTDQRGWLPESALEIRFTAPTGGRAWSTRRLDFGLDYIYDWQIVEGWTLYGSSGFGTNALGDFGFLPEEPATARFIAWTQSAALGTELSQQSTLYLEWFGVFSEGLEEEFSAHFFNVGIDFYLTHHLVLDLRVGVGLSDDADDFFAGVGGGYRF